MRLVQCGLHSLQVFILAMVTLLFWECLIPSIFVAFLKECVKQNFNLQDPLNSGDDVSEQDIADLFDTDNVIVCQYEKVQ